MFLIWTLLTSVHPNERHRLPKNPRPEMTAVSRVFSSRHDNPHNRRCHAHRKRNAILCRNVEENPNVRKSPMPQPELYGKDSARTGRPARKVPHLRNGIPDLLGEPNPSKNPGTGLGSEPRNRRQNLCAKTGGSKRYRGKKGRKIRCRWTEKSPTSTSPPGK